MSVGHRTLYQFAACMTYLLVASGGIVCITDASQGCPDWPICHGRLIPPARMDSILEWSHRVSAALTLPVILAALAVGWRRYRSVTWLWRPLAGAVVGIIVVSAFGAVAVLWGLSRIPAAIDLGTALLTLGLMVTTAAVASVRHAGKHRPGGGLSLNAPLVRHALLATLAVFAVQVGGILVARDGSLVRCLGWPGLALGFGPGDLLGTLALVRVLVSLLAGVLVITLALRALRAGGLDPVLRRSAIIAGVLVPGALAAAALTPSPDAGVVMPIVSLLVSEALLCFCVATTVRAAALDSSSA